MQKVDAVSYFQLHNSLVCIKFCSLAHIYIFVKQSKIRENKLASSVDAIAISKI